MSRGSVRALAVLLVVVAAGAAAYTLATRSEGAPSSPTPSALPPIVWGGPTASTDASMVPEDDPPAPPPGPPPLTTPDALDASITAMLKDIERRDALIPEFARTLEEVFFSKDPTMSFDQVMTPVVDALPDYTRFIHISPSGDVPPLLAGRTLRVLKDRFPKDPRDAIIGAWIRDPFFVLSRPSGKTTLVLAQAEHFADEARQQLAALGFDFRMSALEWSGGNLRADHFKGRRLLFVGASEYGKDNVHDEETQARLFAEEFEADEVVFMPPVPHLFHLDQMFIIVGPGRAVVNAVDAATIDDEIDAYLRVRGTYFQRELAEYLSQPARPMARAARPVDLRSPAFQAAWQATMSDTGPGGVRAYARRTAHGMRQGFDGIAARLEALGYEVIRFPATLERLFDFETYMNSVIYRHRDTGRSTILLPRFGSRPSNQTSNVAAEQFFRRLGFEVVPVHDTISFSAHGGVHCLTNAGRQGAGSRPWPATRPTQEVNDRGGLGPLPCGRHDH